MLWGHELNRKCYVNVHGDDHVALAMYARAQGGPAPSGTVPGGILCVYVCVLSHQRHRRLKCLARRFKPNGTEAQTWLRCNLNLFLIAPAHTHTHTNTQSPVHVCLALPGLDWIVQNCNSLHQIDVLAIPSPPEHQPPRQWTFHLIEFN